MNPRDTSGEALREQAACWALRSGAERFMYASELTRMAHELTRAGIRQRMPSATEAELEWEYFRLVLGDELARRVFEHREKVGYRRREEA